ncbi:Squalene/phytoene synthase [Poseidonocella pacifica]|uniref:Squalene/phytoene synthase n=1 Tax=Poseidonocella pacifica TaxID=871651 RepID=A0A1I0VP05_9RHOB|nr:squalene/phytoene synthase family protein [Poseidonocella pacifica]SFA77733.1 Squalene/phytoene synthase [Poseidonocella pacifica]
MSVAACAEIVQRGDPDRFVAAMAAPPPAREVLFPLYAFNVEVARAPWVTQEAMIAEMRLQWWHDALGEIAQGGEVRRHEVVTPLAGVLDAEGAAVLQRLVEARRWDIYRDAFADDAALDAHISATAGGLMATSARLLGAADEGAVRDFAFASGVANWLCALPELEAQGRIPMVDGSPGGVADFAKRGLAALERARSARRQIGKESRAALLPGYLAGAILKQAAKTPERAKIGALVPSPFFRKLRLMMQAATGRF